jgi:trigger factor
MTDKSSSHSHKHAETELAKPVKKLVKKTDDTKPDLVGPNEVFTLTIARSELTKARQKVLTKAQSQLKTDGFRHGKTPIKIVEQRLGEGAILEMMADEVLSPAYSQALQEKKLQPLSEPEVKPLKMDAEGDWEFEIIVATLPIIETTEVATLVEKLK